MSIPNKGEEVAVPVYPAVALDDGNWDDGDDGDVDAAAEAAARVATVLADGGVELDLSSLDLTAVPDGVGRCTALRVLWLNDNALDALPDALGACTALEDLYLCGNRLHALPDSMRALTRLTRLLAHRNPVAVASAELRKGGDGREWTELKSADLRAHLDRVQREGADAGAVAEQAAAWAIARAEATAATDVDLSDLGLAAVPAAALSLTRVQGLWLAGNALTALPDDISRLVGLTRLVVSRNALTALPDGLRALTGLQCVLAFGNPVALSSPELRRGTDGTVRVDLTHADVVAHLDRVAAGAGAGAQ